MKLQFTQWARSGHASVRHALFDLIAFMRSECAMIGYRQTADDVVGVVDGSNHYAIYKPACHSCMSPSLEQGTDRRPEATACADTRLGNPSAS